MGVRCRIGVSAAILAFVSCSSEPPADSLGTALYDLVYALGDSSLPVEERRAAAEMIAASTSTQVIPALIRSLRDKRVHDPEALPPISSGGGGRSYSESVGQACERLLYRIILNGNAPRGFKVDKWGPWWEENRNKSLTAIRVEAARQNGSP
jgi:hypothetical protein